MITKEDLELLQKAQAIIIKLDGGGSVVGGSQEHLDLSRAITRFSGMLLFQPMTEKDVEKAQVAFGLLSFDKDVV